MAQVLFTDTVGFIQKVNAFHISHVLHHLAVCWLHSHPPSLTCGDVKSSMGPCLASCTYRCCLCGRQLCLMILAIIIVPMFDLLQLHVVSLLYDAARIVYGMHWDAAADTIGGVLSGNAGGSGRSCSTRPCCGCVPAQCFCTVCCSHQGVVLAHLLEAVMALSHTLPPYICHCIEGHQCWGICMHGRFVA